MLNTAETSIFTQHHVFYLFGLPWPCNVLKTDVNILALTMDKRNI